MKTSMWYMLLKLNRASSRVKWTWCVKLKECPLKATERLWFQLKVHYAVLVEIFYKKWNIILCFYAWTNSLCCHDWINKLTFKHNNISHCLTLFICGGPRHLSSFKQYSGPYFPLTPACLLTHWTKKKKKHFSEFVLLHIV